MNRTRSEGQDGRYPFSLTSLFLFAALLFAACGDGSTKNDVTAQSGTGAVAFQVKWVVPAQNASPSLSRTEPNYAASINCSALGVSTVVAAVTDNSGKVLAVGGPFVCVAGSGSISGVPAGTGYIVVFQGISSGNAVAYQGLKTNISVFAGQATNAGTIDASPMTTTVSVLGASSVGTSAASIIAATNTAGTGTGTGVGAGTGTGNSTGTGTGNGTGIGTVTACPTGQTGTYPNCVSASTGTGAGSGTATYTNNGNGTITQSPAGLMWQQRDDGTRWSDTAGTYCAGLTLGGYSGWRLPTIDELKGIVDTSYSPTINPLFTNTHLWPPYLSSTPFAPIVSGSTETYYVNFSDASVSNPSGYAGRFNVRCVRLGP